MMKIATAALALAACLFAQQASAQATNYTFTSGNYATVTQATACTVADCATYTPSQKLVATLTFAAPLAPNLPFADHSAILTSYTFSDGVRTTTGPGPNAAISSLTFATDGTGMPHVFSISLQRTPGPPYAVNAAGSADSYINYVNISGGAASEVSSGRLCIERDTGGVAQPGAGRCSDFSHTAQTSSAATSGPSITVTSAPAPVPVAPVPTLSEWAMILLGAVLAGAAALTIHRRRTA